MKKLILIISLLFASLFSYAEPVSSPLLWKAEKNGKVAYIFGTFHLGFTLVDLPEEFKKYIEASTNFFMEADLSTVNQNEITKRATFSNGQSLDQYLSEESWKKLVEALKGVVPEEHLKSFKPWYISLIINQVVMQSLNLKGTLDLELTEYAKSKGVNIGYLEDIYLQFSVFEAICPGYVLDSEIKEFKKADDLITESKKHMLALYNCYKTSDISCLTRFLGNKNTGGLMEDWQLDIIVRQRNRTWISTIEKSLKSGPSFIAVGVGHLVGQDSVLSLLKEEGFSVKKVQF